MWEWVQGNMELLSFREFIREDIQSDFNRTGKVQIVNHRIIVDGKDVGGVFLTYFMDWIELHQIMIATEERGNGYAKLFMKQLCALADKGDMVIGLSPSSDFGASKGRLTDFYKSFGFKMNSGRSKDFRISQSMIRLPR